MIETSLTNGAGSTWLTATFDGYLAHVRNIPLTIIKQNGLILISMAMQDPNPSGDTYDAVFQALAHATRRRVLVTIFFNGGAMTAGEIAGIFEHAWQTTTRHLRVLERAGLITHERQGRMWIYRIQRKRIELVGDWLAHFSKERKH
jgi:DNA-binding transcriptional ArsR family regulator